MHLVRVRAPQRRRAGLIPAPVRIAEGLRVKARRPEHHRVIVQILPVDLRHDLHRSSRSRRVRPQLEGDRMDVKDRPVHPAHRQVRPHARVRPGRDRLRMQARRPRHLRRAADRHRHSHPTREQLVHRVGEKVALALDRVRIRR